MGQAAQRLHQGPAFREKNKGKEHVSSVNLKAWENTSWELFQARPTGSAVGLRRGTDDWMQGTDNWMHTKKSSSASLFPDRSRSQNFRFKSSGGGNASFWPKEHP